MIALLQLARQKVRFLTGVCGVAFAITLILMQLGFQNALFESATQLHNSMHGDLFILDKKTVSVVSCTQFPRTRLYQALGEPFVESVQPVYIGRANCRAQGASDSRPILVIGVNPGSSVFDFQGVQKLSEEGRVLYDQMSRPEFGPVAQRAQDGYPVWLFMEGKRIKVAGTFSLGVSFGADGNVLASTTTFAKLFHLRKQGAVDVGVIKLRPGTDVQSAQERLREKLPGDVFIFTRKQFVDFEQNYWRSSTAIGFIFRIGVILSFFVGAIIVYQILYSDISDHLKEYATLLAMGYSMRFLYDIVFQEAVILAIVGFIPGLFVSIKLYEFTAKSTGLPVVMDAPQAMLTLSLGIVMCCFAAALSSLRLRHADPADVFSGG